jgi:hypothetical protein
MIDGANYLPLSSEEKLEEMNVSKTITVNNRYGAKTLKRTNKKENKEDISKLRTLHANPNENKK